MKKVLISGDAGLIGSHLVRRFVNDCPQYEIVNLDKLIFAGNLVNLAGVDNKPNYKFIKVDRSKGQLLTIAVRLVKNSLDSYQIKLIK